MSPSGTITAFHIWKRFRTDRRRPVLYDTLGRLKARLRGERGDRWRWALRDVDFVIEPGESVGLVGPNGSGKSTLLKIISRVMYPYAGRVEVSGRVGALIEVRAGIHPQLTGRENVFLYGSLLGHARSEISRRFDEIVAFAEIEDAIDRQTKFYSSGMQMRLGFSVAAFLEPDILLVDEVLAVGDTSFQQKCLDRMREMLTQGTTLMFVSHDLASVEAMCTRGIWLNDGVIRESDNVQEVLRAYRRSIEESVESSAYLVEGLIDLVKVSVKGENGSTPVTEGPIEVVLVFDNDTPRNGVLYLGVSEGPATAIFSISRDVQLERGEIEARCSIASLPLPRGRYYLWAGIYSTTVGGRTLLAWQPITHFEVAGPDLDPAPRAVVRLAPVHVGATWEVERR